MEKIPTNSELVSTETQEQADLLKETHDPQVEDAPFVDYLDPAISLEDRLAEAYKELGIPEESREEYTAALESIAVKDKDTEAHSIRVGLAVRGIAKQVGLDERTLFTAAIFHDTGKRDVPEETLKKKTGWTELDMKEMDKHVMSSYEIVKGISSIAAEIIVGHHSFQDRKYPENLPEYLHEYSDQTKEKIEKAKRILALADVYDALHRVNEKYDDMQTLTGEKVKEKMLRMNPDQVELIEELYKEGIFTTKTYPNKASSN